MKRIAFLAVMMVWAITASATSVLYFTRSQADRAVSYLNRQSELMIYCGYEYEIETYVLLNEVWAEKVNSAYYELWIYGWDAYTGEEIYMPIDLQCIWLYSAGHMYNAAQYLRFRTSGTLHQPTITWTVPAYNTYTRVTHRPGYVRTYHYDVHRHGWMPPTYSHTHHHSGQHHIHPYYLRAPHTPAPQSHGTWTPGVNRPQIETAHPAGNSSGVRPTPTQSGTATSTSTGANPSRSNSTATPTRSENKTNESATPTRSGSTTTTTTPSRSGNTTTSTPSRSNSTTTTTPSRSTTTTTPSRSESNTATAPSRSSNTTSTKPSRSGKSTTTTTPSRSESNTTSTPSRSGSTTSTPSRSGEKSTTATTPTRSGSSATPTRR